MNKRKNTPKRTEKKEKEKIPKKPEKELFDVKMDKDDLTMLLDFYRVYTELSNYSHPTYDESDIITLKDRNSFKLSYKPKSFEQCKDFCASFI
ncbi:MAG: hypothetical protein ACFE9L_08820 [Candidatus Hodarchaeota archaeon]